jgi:hypothetical protein
MTEIETIQGNRLIARFMGDKIIESTRWPDLQSKVFYHNSWDKLMSVVEKINATGKYDVVIYRTTCHINDSHQLLFETSYATSKKGDFKMDIWEPIVEFLKWYNEHKTITK